MDKLKSTLITIIVIALLLYLSLEADFSSNSPEAVEARIEQELYEHEIRKEGYDEGYHYGYAEGFSDGRAEAHSEVAEGGYEYGYEHGYDIGFEDGYYACLEEYGLVEKTTSDNHPPIRLLPDE